MMLKSILILVLPLFLNGFFHSEQGINNNELLFEKCYRSELFFGLTVDGKQIEERNWEKFTEEVISFKFPDGMTVIDGYGKWRNPETGKISSENSKVVILAHKGKKMEELTSIIEAYKKEFNQYAVLLVQGKVYCNF